MLLKKRCIFSGLGVFFALFFSGFTEKSTSLPEETNARTIIAGLFKAIEETKTLKYNLKLSERINGKMVNTESLVKLQLKPRKLYLYLKGPELLWVQGKNNGNAFVNPDDFPYFNLNLSPTGSLMRKNQHHTIHEMGYEYLAGVLKNTVKKAGDKFDKYFVYMGEEKWDNRTCYKVIISYPEFAFENYTAQMGDNIISIAHQSFVSEYMILENNPHIKDYYAVKPGVQLKVPNAYAKITIMLIDKQHLLPINNKIFDQKGLFESYEYHNLIPNAQIADEEFTRYYKGYHF